MSIGTLLLLVTSPHELAAENVTPERISADIQSAEIASSVLSAIAHVGGAHAASELRRQSGMPHAKVYRYLVSLERMGLIEQDSVSARYRLGVQVLRVGLSTLFDVDFMREGSNLLPKPAEWLNEGVLLSIWAARDPVIMHWEGSGRPAAVNVRVRSVMPLLNSATGQACAAWVPEIQIVPLVDRELYGPSAGKMGLTDWLNCHARQQAVRQEGAAHIGGTSVHGTDSVAVPVLDSRGKLAGTIAVLGLSSVFDSGLEGPAARLLREVGRTLSLRLGYHGQALIVGAAAPEQGRCPQTAPGSA